MSSNLAKSFKRLGLISISLFFLDAAEASAFSLSPESRLVLHAKAAPDVLYSLDGLIVEASEESDAEVFREVSALSQRSIAIVITVIETGCEPAIFAQSQRKVTSFKQTRAPPRL